MFPIREGAINERKSLTIVLRKWIIIYSDKPKLLNSAFFKDLNVHDFTSSTVILNGYSASFLKVNHLQIL